MKQYVKIMTHDGPSFPSNDANSEESRKLKPVIIGQMKVAYTDMPSQMLRHTSCTNAAACFVSFFVFLTDTCFLLLMCMRGVLCRMW